MYEALEKTIGRDDAKRVVKGSATPGSMAFETTISEVTEYKWKTSKDELLSEMERRFATKADLALQEARINARIDKVESRIDKLEYKMLLYFLVLIFTIILTNSRALDLLYKLLGLVK
ncbi:hypothetical protein MBAV_002840 [Candidatus Magnetobacterium bavaricum]|uniref:DUF1640 domain-containing protein n=1 Tax=Candidatus Magnetobacterium bavaricum TaxID=29290 RepID=A0A0F3GSJ8_9BACT|nr:hypothetical protein MBAV_002840 [Candidatus Magnetobacterium bavaricum]